MKGTYVVAIACLLTILPACRDFQSDAASNPSEAVVVSLPIVKHVLQPIIGDRPIVVLLKDGQSPHTYQPSPSDARLLSKATVLGLIHPEIDGWAADLSVRAPIYLFKPEIIVDHEDPQITDSVAHDHSEDAHYWSDPELVLMAIPLAVDDLCSVFPSNCLSFRRRATQFSQRIAAEIENQKRLLAQSTDCLIVPTQPFMSRWLARSGLRHTEPITHVAGQSPRPKHLHSIQLQVRASPCALLVAPSGFNSTIHQQWANDLDVSLIEIDPVGRFATSYESYLASLAVVAGTPSND